jgi:hypothetical protein
MILGRRGLKACVSTSNLCGARLQPRFKIRGSKKALQVAEKVIRTVIPSEARNLSSI